MLQFVLLLPVLVHVQRFRLQHLRRALHDGREDAVYRAQHHGGEEHDAQAYRERTQHGEHVYRLGSR